MGFNANPTIYTLDFGDTPFKGLEVRVRRGSVQIRGEFETEPEWRKQLDIFASLVVEWNLLDDDGVVLPISGESLFSRVEDRVSWAMVNTWVRAGTEAPVPLEQTSTPGETGSVPPQPAETTDLELEATMPMTPSLVS